MKNKARKTKGKDETEQLVLFIPQVFIDQCKIEGIKGVLDKFNTVSFARGQIEIIRIVSLYLNTTSVNNIEYIISLLSDLFVNGNPKSPVKKSILRIFASSNLQSQISTILSQQLLQKIKSTDENNVESCNECVNAVNDCFDNFPTGVASVSLILTDVFAFLVNYLKRLVQDLSGSISPVALQDLQLNIHNCTRCFVAVCQQCDIQSIILEYTNVIFEQCITILNNTDISYDTKNNFGIIIVTAANYSVKNGYTILLELCLNKDVSRWGISSAIMQDDITIACICSGILNVIAADELCYKVLNKSALLVMCEKLLQLAESAAGNPSTVLGVNRSLLLISRTLTPLSDTELVCIVTKLLGHIWTYLDHYVDTIRHVAKSTFVNLVKLAKNHATIADELLNIIIESVFTTSPDRSTKYRALAVIAQEAGCEVMLSKEPELVSHLLKQALDSSIATYVLSCYGNLMRCHLQETTDTLWIAIWVTPLVSELRNVQELDKMDAHLQHLLTDAIKLRPSILDSILSQWPVDNEVQLSLLLKCTLITRKIDVKIIETSDKWCGLLDYNVLNLGMCHQNDDIRIASLALIAESQKSTELFTEWELKYIVTFLKYNINTQLPSSRQQIMSLVKKILIRFDAGYDAIYRIYAYLPAQERLAAYFEKKSQYEEFVSNLRKCLFDSLFPGANFSRRVICLEILTLVKPILLKIFNVENNLWKRAEAEAILLRLSDSYESNKKLAVSLLDQCSPELMNLHTIEDTERFIQDALALAASVKPADTVTAAYMLETAGYSPVLMDALLKLRPANEERTPEYHMIRTVLQQLHTEVEIGKNNLLQAAGSAPMHGTLFCLRHLLEKYLFSSTSHDKRWYWKPLVSRIIKTCFEICAIVGPIVNNSSPEGHLPMDQEACEEDATITAQMLLVCAWRSVKEVSLLLGEMTLRLEIESADRSELIREEQVLQIGEHFSVLLTETKHRGAFEQAYVGFAKLCLRLWKCNSEVLHQLPVVWLTEIMNAISGKTPANNKLCATRRSAGVPYMIQAIITSELQCGSSTHFVHCMDTLLQLANSHSDNVETRTHGMNVLRALYRHTQLGEVVTPYLAAGITASILGFSRKTWAERNSATLLFSSLMTRIFGVQRYKEELSIRNRMTARVFFLRHPTLHEFLFAQLRLLTAANCELYQEVALYPILLLLARLYPSTAEENAENTELEDFIPYVKLCAKNRVLKTRELAAKALVPLVPTQRRNALVQELFSNLKSTCQDQNYIHGVLLQILHLLKASPDFAEVLNIESIINESLWILTTNSCNSISASIYMDIIILLTSNTQVVRKDYLLWEELLAMLNVQASFVENNFIIGKSLYQRTSSHLELHVLINICASSFEDISAYLLTNLSHDSNVIKEFILNFIICCLKTQDTEFVINTLEIPDEEKNLTSIIVPQFKTSLAKFLAENPVKFIEKLVEIIKCDERLCSKALFIVSHCAQAAMTLGGQDGGDPFCYFKEQVYSTNDDMATAVLCCIRSCFNNLTEESFERTDMEEVFDILLEFSSLNNCVGCRYIVAMVLVENGELLFGQKRIKYEYLVTLWRTVMQLLEDSEPLVRNTVSKLSKTSVTAEKSREILLSACVDTLKAISEEKCTVLLLFWALTDRDPFTIDEDYEGQVFERGEVNTYVESMCLSMLAAKMLKQMVSCENKNEIPGMFQNIVSILTSDTQLFSECPEKDKFIIVVEELINELSKNYNRYNVLKKYFSVTQNSWYSLNPIFKYKIHRIVRNIVPKSVDF